MQLPRKLLLPACAVLTLAAYYLVLFTDLGNPVHRDGVQEAIVLQAVVVLAAFSCWEVVRTERHTPIRAVAAAVGAPLALFALVTLWYGLRRHLAL